MLMINQLHMWNSFRIIYISVGFIYVIEIIWGHLDDLVMIDD